MKNLFTTVVIAFSLMSFSIQTDTEEIINALKQGNSEQFSKFFDTILDVKLPEKDEIKNIGKNQASITLKNFFRENNIKGFDVTSQRELSDTKYLTGKLQGGSKTYNLTLMMKTKGDKLTIITIRIN
ncbi:MAG: DUF4783 domain-containing protein [Chitinophagaceae bacterium]